MSELERRRGKRDDPLRDALGLREPRKTGETLKKDPPGEAETGTSVASRGTLAEVPRHPITGFQLLLGSDRSLMADKASGPLSLGLTWIATGAMTAAGVALVVTTVFSR